MQSSFDERAYGFGNLVDLLRAAHREGVVRVERDRQGVIRVFQSAAAPSALAADLQVTGPESLREEAVRSNRRHGAGPTRSRR
jgi:hypothetical protein